MLSPAAAMSAVLEETSAQKAAHAVRRALIAPSAAQSSRRTTGPVSCPTRCRRDDKICSSHRTRVSRRRRVLSVPHDTRAAVGLLARREHAALGGSRIRSARMTRPSLASEIAPRLIAAREAARLERDEVARMMMMAPQVLKAIEEAKGVPTEDQTEALARIYGVSMEYLMSGDVSKPALAPTRITPLKTSR